MPAWSRGLSPTHRGGPDPNPERVPHGSDRQVRGVWLRWCGRPGGCGRRQPRGTGGPAAFWWRRTDWPGAGRVPQPRGRLLVWPGDEEAQPSGPVLGDLRHLAVELAAVW